MFVKRASLALLAFLLGNLLLAAVPINAVSAAPSAQGGNLLTSPGFEGGFSGGTAPSWGLWHEDVGCDERPADFNYACQPEWSAETVSAPLIHSGSQSQHVGVCWTPWHGGVMQTVSVPAGTTIRLTAWGRARAAQEQYPAPSDGSVNARMQVGIDPNGQGLWYSQDIVWSGAINPHDVWQSASVEATVGASGQVVVFLSANYKGFSRQHLDTWWDDAVLEVVTPPTATPAPLPTSAPPPPAPVATNTPLPTPTPEPTATPVDTPTPSPTPEPTATSTPAVGMICVTAFDDGNSNGFQDGIEGAISGVIITLFDGREIAGTRASDALAGQVCFENLKPGPYQVFQQVPLTRRLTTADNVPVDLLGGQTVVVLFGSAVSAPASAPTVVANATAQPADPDQPPAEEPPAESRRSSLVETLLAVSGIIVLLVAAVLIGVFFIFRSK